MCEGHGGRSESLLAAVIPGSVEPLGLTPHRATLRAQVLLVGLQQQKQIC